MRVYVLKIAKKKKTFFNILETTSLTYVTYDFTFTTKKTKCKNDDIL